MTTSSAVRIIVLALLYVFAAPVYVVLWTLRLAKVLRGFRAVRSGCWTARTAARETP